MTELEVLARIGGFEKTSPYEIVRETFQTLVPAGEFEERWKRFLHDGFSADSAPTTVHAELDSAAVGKPFLLLRRPARRPRTGSKSFSIGITALTTDVTTTTAGFRNCPTPLLA